MKKVGFSQPSTVPVFAVFIALSLFSNKALDHFIIPINLFRSTIIKRKISAIKIYLCILNNSFLVLEIPRHKKTVISNILYCAIVIILNRTDPNAFIVRYIQGVLRQTFFNIKNIGIEITFLAICKLFYVLFASGYTGSRYKFREFKQNCQSTNSIWPFTACLNKLIYSKQRRNMQFTTFICFLKATCTSIYFESLNLDSSILKANLISYNYKNGTFDFILMVQSS